MIYCPNINLEGWKKMESRLGDSAYYYYYLNDGEYLTDQQIDSILNNETKINKPNVVFEFKGVHLLIKNLDIAKSLWKKIPNKKEFWDKIQNKLQIPKDQIELLKITEGNSLEEIILNFASNYNYTIEINTAKDASEKAKKDSWSRAVEQGLNPWEEGIDNDFQGEPTQYYSNLTVNEDFYKNNPDWEYKEQRITTPLITPSIKGHAQFAQDNDIGWFRAWYNKKTGEVHVLEVQSDLFQKGRNKEDLITAEEFESPNDVQYQHIETGELITGEDLFYGGYTEQEKSKYKIKPFENKQNKNTSENQFLQLLNKNNNWVTFFIKSIIQDSIKKGYEKVLFPTGNTASKVEGHTTLEEFKKQKEDRIKELEKQKQEHLKNKNDIGKEFPINTPEGIDDIFDVYTEEHYNNKTKSLDTEINQLKQELERVEREGFGALRPIYNFYENTVTNILKKQGYNPVLITDEYGNTWNEITLDKSTQGLILLNIDNNKTDIKPKDIGLHKKEISGQQTINVKKKVEEFNKKNGRSIFVNFKRMGQSDLYTWEIVDKAGGQTKMFSLEETPERLTDEQLEDKLKVFLERHGISVEVYENLKLRGISVNGFADILNRVIKLDKNVGVDVFTEEVAHFAIELLGDSDRLVQSLMKMIENTDYYTKVKDQYAHLYTTENEFKKEAIGKALRDSILKLNTDMPNRLQNVLKSLYAKFLGIINKFTNNKFAKQELKALTDVIAYNVLQNKIKQNNNSLENVELASIAHIPKNEKEAIDLIEMTIKNRLNQLKNELDQPSKASFYDKLKKVDDARKLKAFALVGAINILDEQISSDTFKFLGSIEIDGIIDRLRKDRNSYPLTAKTLNNINTFITNYQNAIQDLLSYMQNLPREQYKTQIDILSKNFQELEKIYIVSRNWEKDILKKVMKDITEGYELDEGGNVRGTQLNRLVNSMYDIQSKDSTWFRLFLGSPHNSSNKIIRFIVNRIARYKFVVDKHTTEKINELLPLYSKLVDKGFDFNKLMITYPDGRLAYISPWHLDKYLESETKMKQEVAKALGFETFEEITVFTLSEKDKNIYSDMTNKWYVENTRMEGENRLPALKYNNEKFSEIMSDPDVKSFYEAVMKLRYEDLMRLPERYTNTSVYLKNLYMMPQVSKALIDTWVEKSGLKQYFKDKFRITEDELDFGEKQIVTDYFGNKIKYVPINYFSPVKNPSNDIFFASLVFTEMSKNYEQMTVASADAELLLRVFGNMRFKDDKDAFKGSESKQFKLLKEFFETNIYGKTENEINVPIGGKKRNIAKIIKGATGFTRVLNLAGNVATMFSNVLKSNIDLVVEGIIGKNISKEAYFFAHGEVMRNMPHVALQAKQAKQTNKMHNILLKIVAFDNIKQHYRRVDNSALVRFALTDTFWYQGYEMFSYIMNAKSAVAIMYDFRILDGEIFSTRELKRKGLTKDQIDKLVRYYDNFDDNFNDIIPLSEIEHFKVHRKLQWLVNTIDGKMTATDKALAHKNAITAMVLTHKNWFISGIDRRFKSAGRNLATEEMEVGYYRAFGKFAYNIFNKESGKLIGLMGSWNTLSEEEKIGVQKTLTDLVIFAALVGLFYALHSIDMDDEPEAQFLAYLSSRILLEHSSFIVPTEVIEMFKSPFATATVILRIQDLFLHIFDTEEVDRGIYKGLTAQQKTLIRLTPMLRQFWEVPASEQKDNFLRKGALKPFNMLLPEN